MGQFGNCKFCGAENVRNPKTGKVFCSNKCWLNKPQQNSTLPNNAEPVYSAAPTPDWDKINGKKAEDIRANVVLKGIFDLIIAGKVDIAKWRIAADDFYNWTPVPFDEPQF
jgi:hypothetical protein